MELNPLTTPRSYKLPGFSSLPVKVEHYAKLISLLKSGYHGKMVDVGM